MGNVKFGIEIPTFAGGGGTHRDVPLYERIDWKTTKNTAILAEKLGYESIWMADHFILGNNGEMFEIWTAMSALAAITDRVELGSLVMCTLHRQPSVLAKMAATLDHMSNGRLILGVGAGWNEPELTAYGLSFPAAGERIARMKEGIKVMKAMWTEDKPTYRGKYYSINEAVCRPKPAQHGGPPIIVGAVGPQMLKAAVEVGDGWNLCDDPTVDLYKGKLAIINEWCEKLSKPSESFMKTWDGHVVIGRNQADFNEKMDKLRRLRIPGDLYTLKSQVIPNEMLQNCISGTPDECIKKIKQFTALGVSHFSLWFLDYPSLESMTLFAEQVLPEFS
jgi:alkanesulfonate monooxygenase SsuD/methylene tetrahydromethanopterin reductase-like flavin-dependent oxidoreductase (luciferase family)